MREDEVELRRSVAEEAPACGSEDRQDVHAAHSGTAARRRTGS